VPVACCAFALSSAFAQTTSTSIVGTVTDSSGAAIAGAKVTATNVRTQGKREDVTTSSGDYNFPLLDIGEYSVSVEMSGFKTSNRTNLLLQINEKLRVDFALEVGQVSERVEVTGEAATLKTDEASIGDVIEQKRIVELPINGRNVGNVAVLQAGVMFGARGGLDGQSGSGGGIPIPGQNIALVANGQREVSQHATLDGVVATEARVNTVPFSPSPEAIEEVKVFTGTYSAEYGFNSGAQLIMVMRSGTNQLHGTAFEFLRNDKLDAESYFQNYFNTSATRLPKQGIRQNQFGGMASGPVFIPKVYNGKDKTFWMFNYEGRRRSLPGAAESALVPSDRMRNGDFGELLTRSNASGSLAPVLIYDPLTSPTTPTPFANNVIPANRIAAGAKNLIGFWERPQVVLPDPLSGFNYTGRGGQTINDDQYYVKIDHNFSERDKIMGRYATNKPSWNQVPGASPQFTYLVLGRNDNVAGQWIHVFTPSFIMESRYGYTQSNDDSFNPRANTNFDLTALGLDGFRVVNDNNRKLTPRETGVPSMNVSGFQALAERDGGNGYDQNKLHQLSQSFNLSFGSHNVKAGWEFRRISLYRGAANVPRGSFDFNGNIAGNSVAAFMLGLPTNSNTPEGLPVTDVRQNRMGFYLTDDWKVSRKLTLNLGVRYEYNTAATDVQGLWRSAELRNGGWVFVPPQIRTVYDFYSPQKNLIMPRIGLAYRANDKTVIRAGFGIFYNVHQLNNYSILNLNPPLSGSSSFTNNSTNQALTNPSNPYTFENPFGVVNPATIGTSANILNTDNFQPQVNQWSFDIQRQLPWTMALNVGYIGSKTTHLDQTVELNAPDPAFNTATSTAQSRRPYQFIDDNGIQRQLTRIRFLDSGGNASYHGLQLTLQKRFSNGLSFSIAHTFSKSLMEGYGRNEGDGLNSNTYHNPRNRAAEKGRVGFDVTHNVVANFVYELPFFKQGNAFAKALLGGWQTNGVLTFRTGFPFAVTQGNLLNTVNPPVRPDRVADGSISNPTVNQWFNPDAFRLVSCSDSSIPEACHYGNSGMGILEGPGAKIVDFSLFKNFKMGERFNIQFRSEFYNLFNTPQFARPNTGLNTGAGFLPVRTAAGITYPSQANISRGPGAITSLVSPMRQIQFGLKLLF